MSNSKEIILMNALRSFILMFLFMGVLYSQENKRPYLKNQIHDLKKEKPQRVIPGSAIKLPPPSDAIILFDGRSLNAFEGDFMISDRGTMIASKEGLLSKQDFRDIQMHLEWKVNDTLDANGQKGANSGVFMMGLYEIQILESFVNITYADGQAGALYGQYAPLVNASTPQGNWNSYDIIFKAPVYANGVLKKKATLTLFHNGVAVQIDQPYEGPTKHKIATAYPSEHPEKGPIIIQYHNDPIEFRNIWVRELDLNPKTASSVVWKNPFELQTDYLITPLETERNQKIFVVKEKSIEVLHEWEDKKAPFGMIITNKEYSNYNLELEYKWGERKFEPRHEAKRDAGILFHIQKDKDKIWPSSLECQIQENDTGDLWVIKGPKVSVVQEDGNITIIDSSKERKYVRNVKYNNYEREGWNVVRLEVRASESAKFFVNGHLVNKIKDFFDEEGKPLDKGSILLQAEGAELTYRNIRMQELIIKK